MSITQTVLHAGYWLLATVYFLRPFGVDIMLRLSSLVLLVCCLVGGLPPRGAGVSRAALRVEACVNVAGAQAGKRALLVGVSKYGRGNAATDWEDLNSAPDVEALREVLTGKFGFRAADIKVLKTPAETTRRSIVETFRRFLVEATQAGDIVYFHYSGHGGQTPDTDTRDNPSVGDELDGLDEGLIPSDYISKQDGSNTIRDDELAILLDELARKRPANVTVSVDSCFAGTVTRGGRFKVRGQRWTGASPKVAPADLRRGGAAESAGGFLTRGEATAKGYVVISATRHDELASEYEDENGVVRGLLSYALVKALSAATPQTTYRDIFERINEEMTADNAEQNPQLEGDIDKVLLSGAALSPPPYMGVVVGSDGAITLQAGELQGMTRGSRFALFPAATRDFKTAKPVAEADITQLAATTAVLRLTDEATARGVKPSDVGAARAVETLHRYSEGRLRTYLQGFDPRTRDELAAALRALPLVVVAATGEAWDVRLCASRCPDEKPSSAARASSVQASTGVVAAARTGALVLQRADGSLVAVVPAGATQPAQLRAALEGEARWRFINALANRDPRSQLKIELRIVPVEIETDAATGAIKATRDKPPARGGDGGQSELFEGDHVMIELRNAGNLDAFVTVLDLLNNGKINPIWPHPEVPKTQENKIPADRQWHRVPLPFVFRIEPPYGREVYKAIATVAPADFSPLLAREFQTRSFDAEQQRAAASPLGQLLLSATRGQPATRAAVNPSDWATAVEIFSVSPRPRRDSQ